MIRQQYFAVYVEFLMSVKTQSKVTTPDTSTKLKYHETPSPSVFHTCLMKNWREVDKILEEFISIGHFLISLID